jgi:decaprenylphospho-beta-D-ribofuranose 2-oxidase
MRLYISLIMLLAVVNCKAQIINDFSQLNQTIVDDIVYPTTIEDIQKILFRAKFENKKIAVAGKRHSQGGHAFCPGAIVIDIRKFNRILHLDLAKKIITVQTGATWEHIQNYIHPYGLAIKVMQTAHIFTVGGSLSVNAHGRDPRFGPLIETVRAIRILLASGEIVEASRAHNYELFRLAIGGYGLFGIILEADIELTENALYRKNTQIIATAAYPVFIAEHVLLHPDVGLHYGIMSMAPYNFLKEMVVVNYVQDPTMSLSKRLRRRAGKLREEGHIQLSRALLDIQRRVPFYHSISRVFDWPAVVVREHMPDITCRNNAMRHATALLEYTATTHVHALCSYFIPADEFVHFMDYLRNSCTTYRVRFFAVFTRHIPRNSESFMSYTQRERIEVVIFLVHENSSEGVREMQQWTQSTVSYVLAQGGTYYLPGNLHPTYEHITTAYPQLAEFFFKKLRYDPEEIFANHFYLKYAGVDHRWTWPSRVRTARSLLYDITCQGIFAPAFQRELMPYYWSM